MAQTAFLPFPGGWYSFGLGKYRPCRGTYCLYPYDSLPPLLDFQYDGTLRWLKPMAKNPEPAMVSDEDSQDIAHTLTSLISSSQRLNLTLPDAFLRLMSSQELRDRIPSCTACYFDLSREIVPCPGAEEGYIIRFLNDQQCCVMWYLYIAPDATHCVLASPLFLDDFSLHEDEEEHIDHATVIANTYVCALSFEEFIYRFWLENILWFKHFQYWPGDAALTSAEGHYLAHYTHQNT